MNRKAGVCHDGGRALSLVEVVTCVVIMGVLAGMAIPRYASFTAHQRLEGVASRIEADLALAAREARYGSATTQVSFDVASHEYSMTGVTDPDHTGSLYSVDVSQEPYYARIKTANFGGDAVVRFDGYGAPDTGGVAVVEVGNWRKTVTLDAGSGRAVKSIALAIE